MNEQNNEQNLEEGAPIEAQEPSEPAPEESLREPAAECSENDEAGEEPAASEEQEECSEAVSEDAADETTPDEQPTLVYHWNYQEQAAADTSRGTQTRKNGVLTFAVVMSVCFALTLLILIAALASGGLRLILPSNNDDQLTIDGSDDVDIPYGNGDLEISEDDGNALSLQQISAQGNQVVVAVAVTTATGSGAGSGIIMTEDGYIATNHHVIRNAVAIKVLLYDGREYAATLIGSSEIDDLAVIKIEETGLPVATFGDSSSAVVGDRAVVIGHPAGLGFGWTSTYGFISAINRDVKIRDYSGTLTKKMTLLQTDAVVNSGNSGGPLFNNRGEVIGIITMKLGGNYEGMGFAIPSNGAVPLLEALMRTGSTDGVQSEVSSARPEIGITGASVTKDHYYVELNNRLVELTEEEAAQTEGSFRAGASGVVITAVSTSSDAYDKIIEGDIVTAVDGIIVLKNVQIREILYEKNVGDTIKMTLFRGGEEITVTVLLKAASS